MNPKIILKLSVDMIMTVLLLLLMAFQITGEKAHGRIGSIMFLVFISHVWLNRMWYKNLMKGKYTFFRIVQTIINFLILFLMLASVISGVSLISRSNILINTNHARLIHLVSVYWGFTLMSVHLGMHWGMINGMMKKAIKNKMIYSLLKIISLIVAVHGLYAFIKLDLLSHMFLRTQFVFFDFEQSAISVLFDYLSIMIFWVFLTYYSVKFFLTRKN